MAILERPLIIPQQRLDLEDWNVLLGELRTDAKLWNNHIFSNVNKIFRGFVVSGIGSAEATVSMADATLVLPENSGDFSYYVASSAEPNVTIANLVTNTRNYLEVSLSYEDGSPSPKTFWDANANSGAGAEFQQTVNTVTSIAVNFNVSTSGFSVGGNSIPVAIIDTDGSGNIQIILDHRPLFGRLQLPDNATYEYPWGTKQDPTMAMTLSGVSGTFDLSGTIAFGSETANVVTGGTTSITINNLSGFNFNIGDTVTQASSGATGTLVSLEESFVGVDKNLDSIEEILKALMTEIKLIKGEDRWWKAPATDLSSISFSLGVPNQDRNTALIEGGVISLFNNAGTFELTFSDDAYVQVPGLSNGRNTIVAQTINLPNATSIAYVDIERGTGIDTNLTVTVVDSSSFVDADDLVVIARRVTDGVILGTKELKYIGAEYKTVTVGDGVNSFGDFNAADETAFSSALTHLSTGGTLQVLNGTWTFANDLVISDSEVSIFGRGAKSVINTGTNFVVLGDSTPTDLSGFTIKNVKFITASGVAVKAGLDSTGDGSDSGVAGILSECFFETDTATEATQTTTVSANGAVNHYKMDEGSGINLTDSGSGGVNITGGVSGATWSGTSQDDYASGDTLVFDGASDYVDSGAQLLPLTSDGAFSVAMWVKINAGTNGYLISQKNEPASEGIRFHLQSTDLLALEIRDTGGNILKAESPSIYDQFGNWAHLVASYDGGSVNSGLTIYVNGVALTTTNTGTMAASSDIWGTANTFFGSADGGSSNELTGEIGDVKIWGLELSAVEVFDLYLRERTSIDLYRNNDNGILAATNISTTTTTGL